MFLIPIFACLGLNPEAKPSDSQKNSGKSDGGGGAGGGGGKKGGKKDENNWFNRIQKVMKGFCRGSVPRFSLGTLVVIIFQHFSKNNTAVSSS